MNLTRPGLKIYNWASEVDLHMHVLLFAWLACMCMNEWTGLASSRIYEHMDESKTNSGNHRLSTHAVCHTSNTQVLPAHPSWQRKASIFPDATTKASPFSFLYYLFQAIRDYTDMNPDFLGTQIIGYQFFW